MKNCLFALILLLPGYLLAQEVVKIGKASYAASPPAHEGDVPAKMVSEQTIYVVEQDGRPIPTNDWWTDLLVSKYSGRLWAYPLCVSANDRGIDVAFPIRWDGEGRDMIPDSPLSIHGVNFNPADARAKDWGDWTLTFRMAESAEQYIDATIGHGLPHAWFEFHGVKPVVQVGSGAAYFDADLKPIRFPYTGDHLGIGYGGRFFGLHAPAGTTFEREGDQLKVVFSEAEKFLVVSALPTKETLSELHKYAYGIPRDSFMEYMYDPDEAVLGTTWTLDTESLNGAEGPPLQGWIPHHYRETEHNLDFTDIVYDTPRGKMKCSATGDHEIYWKFNGFLPFQPKPEVLAVVNDFKPERQAEMIAAYAKKNEFKADTYWGGKDLVRAARYMMAAKETGHADYETLKGQLRAALVDWLTYDPNEKERYFARYPNWGALVGFNESYGSNKFTDHHFHYGYFTTAGALLGMEDPSFLDEYGDMLRLVAKEYANHDRADKDFPFLRTFDPWIGHSYAGGLSSGGGNNQESTSEAVQSWGGLFLLGQVLDDADLVALGAMGYAMETDATREYWLDVHGDFLQDNYPHPMVGILWNGGRVYATYFSGDPGWIHGIQWFPMSPMLNYLVEDYDVARKDFLAMMKRRKEKEGTASYSSMGSTLGNIVLSYVQLFEPGYVVKELDKLYAKKDPILMDPHTGGLTYFNAHSNRRLGRIQWDFHMSIPTSCVYFNPISRKRFYAVYNAAGEERVAKVFSKGQKLGGIRVPARSMVVTEKIDTNL